MEIFVPEVVWFPPMTCLDAAGDIDRLASHESLALRFELAEKPMEEYLLKLQE